jgi:hypothetical protein
MIDLTSRAGSNPTLPSAARATHAAYSSSQSGGVSSTPLGRMHTRSEAKSGFTPVLLSVMVMGRMAG